MNKHYIALALLMSICTSGLIKAGIRAGGGITIQTGSNECTSMEDVQNEKKCTTRGTPFPGKCVADAKSDGTPFFACRYQVNGPVSMETRSNVQYETTSTTRSNGTTLDQNSNTTAPATNQATDKPASTNFSTYIFSQDIQTPIYNLPMQRTLVPLSHYTIECPWFFSIAPYGKTTQKQTIDKASCENTETGSLVQIGYYGSHWFVNTIASFNGNKTEARLDNNLQAQNEWIFGSDALFALGLKTNNNSDSTVAAYGELFCGVSSNRLDNDNSHKVFVSSNPSTGIQGNIDWTFATFNYCKFELSAFSRFTHFFKKTIESGNQKISYTPGSFVDVLLGLTQYYGSDYQHQFEIGYNPTVRVIKAEALNEKDAPAANLNEPEAGKLYHTAYATYSYNWETNGLPMAFSLGGSATVTPHTNTYGTVFGTFGLSF